MSDTDDLFKELDQLSSDSEDEKKKEEKPKKGKKPLSEVAKQARIANLAKGREKRKKMVEQKKKYEQKFGKQYYDDSDSSSDEDEHLPKKMKGKGKKISKLKAELEQTKSIVHKLMKKTQKEKTKNPLIINNMPPAQTFPAFNQSNPQARALEESLLMRF